MLEFITYVDQYLCKLGEIFIPPRWPTLYPSPSPLSKEAEKALHRTELMYEISTCGTLDGEFTLAPLYSDHPHYRETCFKCHCHGHLQANCSYYEYSHYLCFNPGHSQHHCPHCPVSPPSLSSSSAGIPPSSVAPPSTTLIGWSLPMLLLHGTTGILAFMIATLAPPTDIPSSTQTTITSLGGWMETLTLVVPPPTGTSDSYSSFLILL